MDAQVHHVVGHTRSGTTLTRNVLGRHPEIGITTELRFLSKVLSCHAAIDLGTRKGRRRYVEAVKHTVRRNSGPLWEETKGGVDAVDDLLEDEDLTHRRTFLRLAEAMTNDPEADIVVSKTAGNVKFPYRIHEHLPEARIVHLVRDPRAVYASAESNDWDVTHRSLPASWTKAESVIAGFADEHPGKVLTVRYEDLCSEPRKVVPKLAEFLGLDYDEAMLEVRDRNTSYDDLEHPGGISPPHRRFRETLTAREQATIRDLSEPWFSRRGYEAEEDGTASGWDRALHRAARAREDYDHRVMLAGHGVLTGRWGQQRIWRILRGLP